MLFSYFIACERKEREREREREEKKREKQKRYGEKTVKETKRIS